jgi:ectoine hydroxylase-related dioxygenase (phytanoyl-CoA dioxygenase family)
MYALGAMPIAANAGDFILWHQALPHGSSPNTATLPRFVQYINYEPADHKESRVWL